MLARILAAIRVSIEALIAVLREWLRAAPPEPPADWSFLDDHERPLPFWRVGDESESVPEPRPWDSPWAWS